MQIEKLELKSEYTTILANNSETGQKLLMVSNPLADPITTFVAINNEEECKTKNIDKAIKFFNEGKEINKQELIKYGESKFKEKEVENYLKNVIRAEIKTGVIKNKANIDYLLPKK